MSLLTKLFTAIFTPPTPSILTPQERRAEHKARLSLLGDPVVSKVISEWRRDLPDRSIPIFDLSPARYLAERVPGYRLETHHYILGDLNVEWNAEWNKRDPLEDRKRRYEIAKRDLAEWRVLLHDTDIPIEALKPSIYFGGHPCVDEVYHLQHYLFDHEREWEKEYDRRFPVPTPEAGRASDTRLAAAPASAAQEYQVRPTNEDVAGPIGEQLDAGASLQQIASGLKNHGADEEETATALFAATQGKIKICEACGVSYKATMAFCSKCGRALSSLPSP